MITLPTEDLQVYLLATSALIPKRGSLPVLECIHIAWHDHVVQLTTTDLETTITSQHTSTSNTGAQAGALCVKHNELLNFCSALADDTRESGEITITLSGNMARVAGSRASTRLRTIDPEQWPQQQQHIQDTTIGLVACNLLAALVHGGLSIATNDSRPTLTGMHISEHAGGLRFQSADGFSCSRYVLPADTLPAFDPIVVPGNWCERAIAVLKRCSAEEAVDLIVGHYSATLVANGMHISCRLVDGQFPNTDFAFNYPDDMSGMAIDASELQRLRKALQIASIDRAIPTLWHAADETLMAYAANTDSNLAMCDPVAEIRQHEGAPWLVGFDLDRLLKLCAGARAQHMHMRVLSDRGSILVVFADNHVSYLSGMSAISALGYKMSKGYEKNAQDLKAALVASASEAQTEDEEELFPEEAAA